MFRSVIKVTHRYDAESTRAEIIRVAMDLFLTKGYDKTTIKDIVSQLEGLSKGAVYHHFKSKEAIVDEVIRLMLPKYESMQEISENQKLSGLEKMRNLLLLGMFEEGRDQSAKKIAPLMDNQTLLLKHLKQTQLIFTPYIERFIIEGNKDGSLTVEYPREMAELALFILNTWYMPSFYSHLAEHLVEKIKATQLVLRQMGMDILSDAIFQQIMAKLISQEQVNNEKKEE
ncbi:hypothetical protein CBF34_08985 [Vagococcus penaei]|uniref:Uncharacterized protein n=1 Tax=Vagococcus penaei TaxID=633807 RepID=A0A1Q2D4S6_9ENTE|nr:hypothetical protein BW732_03475 [Vagococcus penaei]RST99710.1 hypothetical protein CBF34_08985 [Vagococcus penaei]